MVSEFLLRRELTFKSRHRSQIICRVKYNRDVFSKEKEEDMTVAAGHAYKTGPHRRAIIGGSGEKYSPTSLDRRPSSLQSVVVI